MYMFRDQLVALERRPPEYILRVSDLEKLRIQLQRCWTFVSSIAQGSGSPVDVAQTAGQQLAPNGVGGGLENSNFQGVVMKAGLRVEDLKPPPAKKRGSMMGPSGVASGSGMTPTASGPSPASAVQTGGVANADKAGTGQSYASPISLDSPSPGKAEASSTGPSRPSIKKTNTAGSSNTPDSTFTAPGTPRSAAAALGAKPKAKPKGRGAVNAKTPLSNDISLPPVAEADPPVPQSGTGQTPKQPSQALPQLSGGASQVRGLTEAQSQAVQQAQVQAQQLSLKRKRELEEANDDPAGFAERIFASYLSADTKQHGQPAGLGRAQNSQSSGSAGSTGLSAAFGEDLMRFLNEDFLAGDEAKAPPVSVAATISTPYQAAGPRWFSETPSFSAETPELFSEDPHRTSPPDNDFATPSDALNSSTASAQQARPSALPSVPPKASTADIISSFDKEYEELFKAVSVSAAPSTASLPPGDLAWSWDSGLVPTSAR